MPGLKKKLVAASKLKDCEIITKWIKSIINHLYWTAGSSSSGAERAAKWESVINHIHGHHIHDSPLFPRCLHPDIPDRMKKAWIQPGS